MEKNLYIIAGCNGAGKTTASFTILPEILDCKEFVNADEIAKGLSPFQPEKVSFEAGRIMLDRINELLKENENFAFEIERRYLNGIKNLFEIYLPIIDVALIFGNSEGKHELIAEKINESKISIVNDFKYKQLKEYYENKG